MPSARQNKQTKQKNVQISPSSGESKSHQFSFMQIRNGSCAELTNQNTGAEALLSDCKDKRVQKRIKKKEYTNENKYCPFYATVYVDKIIIVYIFVYYLNTMCIILDFYYEKWTPRPRVLLLSLRIDKPMRKARRPAGVWLHLAAISGTAETSVVNTKRPKTFHIKHVYSISLNRSSL